MSAENATRPQRAMSAKRPNGTGGLYVRTDATGREILYGHWRKDGRQVKRRLGPKRQRGSREGLTQTEAEVLLRKLMGEVKPREAGETLTIAELGEHYLAYIERRGRKHSTVVAVESIIRVWLAPYFGDRDVRTITKHDVKDVVKAMEDGNRPGPRQKGDRRHGRPVGPKSIRNYVGTLSAILNYGMREGVLSANVARLVDLPPAKAGDADIHFLTLDEVNALVDAARPGAYHAIDRALYLSAAMTGLRQGELVALRWRDVDWPAAKVRVRQNYVLGEFGAPKSRRSTRAVPLADAVAGELDRLFKASSRQGEDDLVFADPHTGGPIDKAAILRRYRRALKAAKLDESHRFHDLRHTFGTLSAAKGVPMRTLQEWMGHRDIDTTQRYADYAPSAHEGDLINQVFAPEQTPTAVGS
jgi:integrase